MIVRGVAVLAWMGFRPRAFQDFNGAVGQGFMDFAFRASVFGDAYGCWLRMFKV